MASAQTSFGIRHELDFYPTPEFYTNALIKHVPFEKGDTILCPFVGAGHIPLVLNKFDDFQIIANDIKDYGYPLQYNFNLANKENYDLVPDADWVVDNPPYDLFSNNFHLEKLHSKAKKGLCLLFRQTYYSAGSGQRGVSKRGRWLNQNPVHLRINVPRYPFANNSRTGKPQTDAANHEWFCWFNNGYRPEIANPVETSETVEGWQWRFS